eukprot:g55.t1
MIFLIEADQLSHTSIPNINLNTNARELYVYNPRCTNPSHILIYDGIWWISNFRSIYKDLEKKQIRKITNSKKIPLTIVSNPDRAKKIRQVLHKVGVRVGGKPIANTIQVFRLEDYIYVLKQCGREEDEYKTLSNVFKKYGKEKPKQLEAVFANHFSYLQSTKDKSIKKYPVTLSVQDIKTCKASSDYTIKDQNLSGESISKRIRYLKLTLISAMAHYKDDYMDDIKTANKRIKYLNSKISINGVRTKRKRNEKHRPKNIGMDSVECVYFEKKLTESDFIQNIEELDIPVRLSKNPKEQTSKSIYKKYYSNDSVVFSSIASLWKIRTDIHHTLHTMRDIYKFILIGERGKEVIDNLIASWVLQKIHAPEKKAKKQKETVVTLFGTPALKWEKFFFKSTLMENEKYFQCIFPYILSCLFGPRMVEACNTNVISALDYKALERPMKPSFLNGIWVIVLREGYKLVIRSNKTSTLNIEKLPNAQPSPECPHISEMEFCKLIHKHYDTITGNKTTHDSHERRSYITNIQELYGQYSGWSHVHRYCAFPLLRPLLKYGSSNYITLKNYVMEKDDLIQYPDISFLSMKTNIYKKDLERLKKLKAKVLRDGNITEYSLTTTKHVNIGRMSIHPLFLKHNNTLAPYLQYHEKLINQMKEQSANGVLNIPELNIVNHNSQKMSFATVGEIRFKISNGRHAKAIKALVLKNLSEYVTRKDEKREIESRIKREEKKYDHTIKIMEQHYSAIKDPMMKHFGKFTLADLSSDTLVTRLSNHPKCKPGDSRYALVEISDTDKTKYIGQRLMDMRYLTYHEQIHDLWHKQQFYTCYDILKDMKTNGYNTNSLLDKFKEVLNKANIAWSNKFIK